MTKTKNRRYFDVNVFVYYLTADKTYGERAKEWFSTTERRYTSVITPFLLTVVLGKLLGRSLRDYEFIKTIVTALESLGIEYLELPEWGKVVENVRKYNVDVEDSIHITTAFENGLTIVSNDEELKRKANAEF